MSDNSEWHAAAPPKPRAALPHLHAHSLPTTVCCSKRSGPPRRGVIAPRAAAGAIAAHEAGHGLQLHPEQEEFRRTLRSFLTRTKAEVFGASDDLNAGTDSDERWERLLEYHRRLYNAGYVALHWPKEWGGGGAELVEQAIYQDEALRLGLPIYGANTLAIDRIGPTLIFLGNDEQRNRYLPKMLTAEEIWCQGYSEPNAGSDLAGLANPRRDRGRLLRRQRPEDLDQPGPARPHAGAAGAHRSQGAQAHGHLLFAGRHEKPRYHRASAAADNRRFGIQRGLLRQRQGAARETWSARSTRDGRCRSRL